MGFISGRADPTPVSIRVAGLHASVPPYTVKQVPDELRTKSPPRASNCGVTMPTTGQYEARRMEHASQGASDGVANRYSVSRGFKTPPSRLLHVDRQEVRSRKLVAMYRAHRRESS